MTYKVSLKPGVIKTLKHINEPYYSKIKEAIYHLAENPRPYGYIKLKKEMPTESGLVTIGSFMILLMLCSGLK